MLRLMRKDLMLNWYMVLLLFALTAGMTLYMGADDTPPLEPLAIVMVASSVMGLTLPAREDRFKASGFTCTLPVTRRRVTLARYLLSVLQFPVLLAFIVLVLAAARGFRLSAEILRPGSILFLLAVYLLTLSIFYPFTVRFGFLGLMVGLVAFQVAGLALMALVSRRAHVNIVSLAGAISSPLRDLEAAVGTAAYFGIVLAALACLYGASFLVSDAVYRRKDM